MGFVSIFILIGILYLANLPLQWLVTNAFISVALIFLFGNISAATICPITRFHTNTERERRHVQVA